MIFSAGFRLINYPIDAFGKKVGSQASDNPEETTDNNHVG